MKYKFSLSILIILVIVLCFGSIQTISGIADLSQNKINSNIEKIKSIVEGEVLDISQVPDVNNANYPDCYYTVKFKVYNILKGKPTYKLLQLTIPAFYNYKLTPYTKIKKNNKLKIEICLFEKISAKKQSIQCSDDLSLFELENYFVLSGNIIESYSNKIFIVNFIEKIQYRSGFKKPINMPIASNAVNASKKAIKKELEYINSKLKSIVGKEKQINESFNLAWDKNQNKYDMLGNNKIWAHIGKGFFSLPKKYRFINKRFNVTRKAIKGIKSLSDYLGFHGIQLIIQVIPSSNDISSRILNPEYKNYIDYSSALITKKLLENDIEAEYTADAIVERSTNYQFSFFYPDNPHPAYGCQDVLTDLMVKKLKRFDIKYSLNRK